jgi:hypothetical protein
MFRQSLKTRVLGRNSADGNGEVAMSRSFGDVRRKVRRLSAVGATAALMLLSAIAAASAAELYGSVSAGGKGQANVTVELLSDQGSVATVQTSRQGTYRFRNIAPGNYRVRAGGQENKVYVGPGVNRFNIAK